MVRAQSEKEVIPMSNNPTEYPMCKLCGTRHRSGDRHDPAGIKATTRNKTPAPTQKAKQKFSQGKRSR